jgi:predicted transcriptional regulator
MVDYVAVKGKAAAIKLYEVLDAEEEDRRTAKESTREALRAGMDAYFHKDFLLAHKIFTAAAEQDVADPVLSIFAERCRRYMENPPSAEWQGYEKLVHK